MDISKLRSSLAMISLTMHNEHEIKSSTTEHYQMSLFKNQQRKAPNFKEVNGEGLRLHR